jgi:hypothetical protein
MIKEPVSEKTLILILGLLLAEFFGYFLFLSLEGGNWFMAGFIIYVYIFFLIIFYFLFKR